MITSKQQRCIRFIEAELADHGVVYDGGDDGNRAFEFIGLYMERAKSSRLDRERRFEEFAKRIAGTEPITIHHGGMYHGRVYFGNDNSNDERYIRSPFRLWR